MLFAGGCFSDFLFIFGFQWFYCKASRCGLCVSWFCNYLVWDQSEFLRSVSSLPPLLYNDHQFRDVFYLISSNIFLCLLSSLFFLELELHIRQAIWFCCIGLRVSANFVLIFLICFFFFFSRLDFFLLICLQIIPLVTCNLLLSKSIYFFIYYCAFEFKNFTLVVFSSSDFSAAVS